MTILNKYVLKKFLAPFFTIFGLMCIIILVSHVLERLDRFLAEGVTLLHVLGYLGTSLPIQALQFLPVSTFMATLFVVGNLARNNEYVAGMASGIAPEKFLGGLLSAGLCISLFALMANESFIPPMTKYSRDVYRQKIRHLGSWEQTVFPNLFVSGKNGRIWSVKVFYHDRNLMDRVLIDTYDQGQIGTQIVAESASWVDNQWRFENGVVREFNSDGTNVIESKEFKSLTLPFDEKPDDLVTQEPSPEEMTYSTLKKHIKRLNSLGIPTRKLTVELMMKLSFPFSCFIVTILAIPLSLREKGSVGKGIATALILTLIYMGFMEFGKALAQRLIPPLLGAWLGNIVFLTYALKKWKDMRNSA